MKSFVIVFTFLFSGVSLFAQNKIENAGPPLEFKEAEFFYKFLGDDGDCFYSLRYSTKGKGFNYFVEKCSKAELKRVNSFNIGKELFDSYVIHKNRLYLFSRKINQQQKITEFIVNTFNLNTCLQEEKDKVITALPYTESNFEGTFFGISFSPDSSKMAVVSTNTGLEKVKELTFELFDFDSFRKTGTRKLPNQHQNTLINSYNFKLDNQGDLYCFFRYQTDDAENYNVRAAGIAKYSVNSDKVLKFVLEAKPGASLYNPAYQLDKKNQVIYLYSMANEKKDNASAFENHGMYVAKIEANTLNLLEDKVHFFPDNIVSQLTCNKPNVKLSTAYSPRIEFTNDQEFFIETDRTSAGIYNDKQFEDGYEIIVAKFNQALEMNWIRMIPRSVTCVYSSVYQEKNSKTTTIRHNDKLSYLFIEHPKFEINKIDFKAVNVCTMPNIAAFKNTNCVTYTIDSNGNVVKDIVYENNENWVVPNDCVIKTGENKYIVRFSKDKKESFGILELK